jgi:hypothetical protein
VKKLIIAAMVLALAGLAFWIIVVTRETPPTPASVKLTDGTSVRILAVTYGTNHIVGSKLAKETARLPFWAQDILKYIFGQRAVPIQTLVSATPELIVWIDHQTNNPGVAISAQTYFEASLGDSNNFISGDIALLNGFGFGSPEPLRFNSFPRRDPFINLNFFGHDAQGNASYCNKLSFANPQFKKYPTWQPESLPITKQAGDVDVTFLRLETGHDHNMSSERREDGSEEVTFGTNRLDGRNNTAVYLNVKPLGNTNEVWQTSVQAVSDATGNMVNNFSTSWSSGYPGFGFSPGLWPEESAWKLKLTLKRTKGFRPEEILVFKNVPLGKLNHTNVIAWSTNFDGIAFTLQSLCRKPPQTNGWRSFDLSSVRLTDSGPPAGTEWDLIEAVYDTGKSNQPVGWESGGSDRSYRFAEFPANAQTADFIFAVQNLRTVEFTVKPELPKPVAKSKK